MVRKVIIEREVLTGIRDLFRYIRKQSLQNAERVRDGIYHSIEDLAEYPERHPPDKYRSGNDGSYRAYEIYSYRIAYRVEGKRIIVFRIRHTSQEPLSY